MKKDGEELTPVRCMGLEDAFKQAKARGCSSVTADTLGHVKISGGVQVRRGNCFRKPQGQEHVKVNVDSADAEAVVGTFHKVCVILNSLCFNWFRIRQVVILVLGWTSIKQQAVIQ